MILPLINLYYFNRILQFVISGGTNMTQKLTILIMMLLLAAALVTSGFVFQTNSYARFTQQDSSEAIDSSNRISMSVEKWQSDRQRSDLADYQSNRRRDDLWNGLSGGAKRDGNWYAIDEEQIVNDIAVLLPPGKTQDFAVTWENRCPKENIGS